MAIYHCRVKPAQTNSTAHSAYIERELEFEKLKEARGEDIIRGHDNFPEWAENEPRRFWEAQEQFERSNANAYREIEIALPKELKPEQMEGLVKEFSKEQFQEKHAYEYAIHLNEKNPHAHVMFSEKEHDGITRSAEQYFKRYNPKAPERGGCKKTAEWKPQGRNQPSERMLECRKSWEVHCNRALERAHVQARVDHRSLKDQGIDRTPQIRVGYRDPARPEIHAARFERNEDIKASNRVPELKQQALDAALELREASRAVRSAKRARAMAQQRRPEQAPKESPGIASERAGVKNVPIGHEAPQARPEVQQRPQEAPSRQGPSESAVKSVDDRFARVEANAASNDQTLALRDVVNKAKSYVNAEQTYGRQKVQVGQMTGIDRRFGLQDLKELGAARDQAQKAFQGVAKDAAMKFGKDLVKNAVATALGPHAQLALKAAELVRSVVQSHSRGR